MSCRARVQDNNRAAPCRGVFLAHHQLGPMGCAGPVDATQVIAISEAADGHIVLAVQGSQVGYGPFRAYVVTPGASVAEELDAGQDENIAEAGQRNGNGGQAIGILPV